VFHELDLKHYEGYIGNRRIMGSSCRHNSRLLFIFIIYAQFEVYLGDITMTRHDLLKYAAMFAFLALLLSPVTVLALSDDGDDYTEEETETEEEHEEEDEYEEEHEPEHSRDSDGTAWIQTDIVTVRLDNEQPMFQFWYTSDVNGSHARFLVSYLMIVEFEDLNGDNVYQVNETLDFAPLDAFEWVLQTGAVTDELGHNTEVYASYTKGGLSDDWEDDWFEDWMPGYEEDEVDDPEEPFLLSSGSDDINFSRFEGLTLQFYAHMYLDDYNGSISDDEGIKANYTVLGGVELKIDIEIGNFPYLSETSNVAVLNLLQEDVASTEDSDHHFRLHEDDEDEDHDSEDETPEEEWGEKFEDDDEDDDGHHDEVQELSLVDASTDTTRGFYRWLDKAVMTLPGGSQQAVDVDASYWTNGNALLLFFSYPNFDGGSLLHDPSMRFVELAAPPGIGGSIIPEGLVLPATIAIALVAMLVIGIIVKRR
jgi:hypothetical protein